MTKINASKEVSRSVPPRENLVRALAEAPTLVRTEGAAMPTLTGHFAVWDQWTEINSAFEGHFLERFAATSMNKTMRESKDQMRVLFNHGKDPQVGDKVLGPIARLESDSKGASYEVPLLDTSYNRDLIPGLDAGLYGASFRFQVISEEFVNKPKSSDHNPKGLPERTVTEAKVREFGPVTFPAYAGATAGLRSITDRFLLESLLEDPDGLRALITQKIQDEPLVTFSTTGERATWSAAFINNLPDSSFLYIEPGGSKDSEGKTTPRDLRHFPYKDANGNIDLPHLRNALARIPQSSLPAGVKDTVTAKAQKILANQRTDTIGQMLTLAYHEDPDAMRDVIELLEKMEPESPEATTPDELEPEPSGATTRTEPGLEPEPPVVTTPHHRRFDTREEWLEWISKT